MSTLARKTPLKRGGRIKPKKRSAEEFARIYHSEARVKFIKWLGCIVCGATPCDGHHTKNGGTGRKSGYETIVPLCRAHHEEVDSPNSGPVTMAAKYGIDWEAEARQTHECWQSWGPENEEVL